MPGIGTRQLYSRGPGAIGARRGASTPAVRRSCQPNPGVTWHDSEELTHGEASCEGTAGPSSTYPCIVHSLSQPLKRWITNGEAA